MRDRSLVVAFRAPRSLVERIRVAAARDDRLVSPFLRRLIQQAMADVGLADHQAKR